MAVALAVSCVKNGGTVLNYFRVNTLLKDDKGKIAGVRAMDTESGKEYNIHGRLVINATGVFADEIHRMDDPSSRQTIRPSQGVHIVLDSSFLQSSSAIMIPKTDDGRVLFAIPWYGKIVVGTTDTPIDLVTLEPTALNEEIDFILRTAGKYLIRPPKRKDVKCIFAGLRPLAANPDKPEATREVSRRHKITLSASGLLSIIGGKWTSYRRMAEETIDKAIKAGIIENKKCITKDFSFYSNNQPLKYERLKIYGNQSAEIEEMIAQQPALGELIDDRLPYTQAEIIWICRNEMPRTLEDMLARRTRSLFLDARASGQVGPKVADLMATELGFSKSWQDSEVSKYNQLISNYL
jgi:glycerol-3-phosphate dehydrogenase